MCTKWSDADALIFMCAANKYSCQLAETDELSTAFAIALPVLGLAAAVVAFLLLKFCMGEANKEPLQNSDGRYRTRQTIFSISPQPGNINGRKMFPVMVAKATADLVCDMAALVMLYRPGGPLDITSNYFWALILGYANDLCLTDIDGQNNIRSRPGLGLSSDDALLVTDYNGFYIVAVLLSILSGFLWVIEVCIACGRATAVGAGEGENLPTHPPPYG